MDLVSVIIPYYKKKKFIRKTLISVINQTYKKLEIIIIYNDPNYTDLKYIKRLCSLDKRIKLLIYSQSIGAGISRNIGINHAKGQYISFLDSDDLWHKDKTLKQIQFMKKNQYSFTHTNYIVIENNKSKSKIRKAKDFYKYTELLKSCDIGLSSVIIKKNILSKNCLFPNIKTKEDFILWLKILKKRITIRGLNENLMYWRKLDNSLSSSAIQKILDGYKVYSQYMKFNKLKSLYLFACLSINYLLKK